MILISIPESNVKDFMKKLLKETLFDNFEINGVEIISFTKFEISGKLYEDNERKNCTWRELRPYIFNIIKGTQKPKISIINYLFICVHFTIFKFKIQ